jgi:hypothetical protein
VQRGCALGERHGWFLKKSKTSRPWAKAAHSRRWFVSCGPIVTYFEKPATNDHGGEKLRGVIDLREALLLKATVDETAPDFALDIMVKGGRTYTIVPQPATTCERAAWMQLWVPSLKPELVPRALLALSYSGTSRKDSAESAAPTVLREANGSSRGASSCASPRSTPLGPTPTSTPPLTPPITPREAQTPMPRDSREEVVGLPPLRAQLPPAIPIRTYSADGGTLISITYSSSTKERGASSEAAVPPSLLAATGSAASLHTAADETIASPSERVNVSRQHGSGAALDLSSLRLRS